MLSSSPLGYEGWDQGLKSLGDALFPDQLKIAQGYYYGTEARNKQLQSNKLIDQQNAANYVTMQSQNQPASPVFQQTAIPGAAPILAPPPNLPMQPPLSSVMTTGPAGGAVHPPTMTPGQAVAQMGQMLENSPTALQGQPQPGSPAYERPTGSDGSVPANDPGSAAIHPVSVTPEGGGPRFANPANHDGSPAQVMGGLNLQTYVAMAVRSGMDAAQAQALGQAALATAVQQGRITPQQYNQLLAGTGATQPHVADINAASAARTTGMIVGGENYRAGLPLQEITDPVTGVTSKVPLSQLQGLGGRPTMSTTELTERFKPVLTQPEPGGPVYSQPAYKAQQPVPAVPAAPGEVPGEPGRAAQPAQPGQRIFEPNVEAERQRQAGAYGDYIDPKNPSVSHHTRADNAEKQGWVAQPKTVDEWTARMNQAIAAERDPERRQQLAEQYATAAAVPKAIDPNTAYKQNQVNYITDQQMYALPDPAVIDLTRIGAVQDPVMFTPDAQTAIDVRAHQLTIRNRYLANDPTLAHRRAVEELQKEKVLPTPQEILQLRQAMRNPVASDPRLGIVQPAGAKAATRHLMIDIKRPGEAGGAAGGGAGAPSLSTVVVPQPGGPSRFGASVLPTTPSVPPPARPTMPITPAPVVPSGGAPPGALGPAPGQPDGKTGMFNGQRSVVRGGWAYPLQ